MKHRPPVKFQNAYHIDSVIRDFINAFYHQRLTYLASDLIDKGFSAEDIKTALSRAMTICKNAKLEVAAHFLPIYSDRDGVSVYDCKLSLLGYRLLLLNANPEHPATAHFQLQVLEQISDQVRLCK